MGLCMYDFSKKELLSISYPTHCRVDASRLIYKDKDAYDEAIKRRDTVSYSELYTPRAVSPIKTTMKDAFIGCAAELSKRLRLDLVVNGYRDRISAVFSSESEIVVTELEPLLSMSDEVSTAVVGEKIVTEFILYLYEKYPHPSPSKY